MRPCKDNILARKLKKEQLGKVIIPDGVIDEWARAEVLKVGPGIYDNGTLIKPDVKEGDIIIFPSNMMGVSIPTICADGEECLLIPDRFILAVETE